MIDRAFLLKQSLGHGSAATIGGFKTTGFTVAWGGRVAVIGEGALVGSAAQRQLTKMVANKTKVFLKLDFDDGTVIKGDFHVQNLESIGTDKFRITLGSTGKVEIN